MMWRLEWQQHSVKKAILYIEFERGNVLRLKRIREGSQSREVVGTWAALSLLLH